VAASCPQAVRTDLRIGTENRRHATTPSFWNGHREPRLLGSVKPRHSYQAGVRKESGKAILKSGTLVRDANNRSCSGVIRRAAPGLGGPGVLENRLNHQLDFLGHIQSRLASMLRPLAAPAGSPRNTGHAARGSTICPQIESRSFVIDRTSATFLALSVHLQRVPEPLHGPASIFLTEPGTDDSHPRGPLTHHLSCVGPRHSSQPKQR